MTWDSPSFPAEPDPNATLGREESVELVGMHLRLSGVMTLGRFSRLSDLVNYSGGYVRIQDAHLLRRNGDETRLMLPELLVNQDEISFIAQKEFVPGSTGGGGDVSERPSLGGSRASSSCSRPGMSSRDSYGSTRAVTWPASSTPPARASCRPPR